MTWNKMSYQVIKDEAGVMNMDMLQSVCHEEAPS